MATEYTGLIEEINVELTAIEPAVKALFKKHSISIRRSHLDAIYCGDFHDEDWGEDTETYWKLYNIVVDCNSKKTILTELKNLDEAYQGVTGSKTPGQITRDYFRSNVGDPRTMGEINRLYGSFSKFRARVFPPIEEEEKKKGITRESFDKTLTLKNTRGKTYFVTAAIAGQSLDKNFFQSIQTFCKEKNAQLIVLPMRGIVSKDDEFTPDIEMYQEFISTEVSFNENLKAQDMRLSPQQILPLTGFSRLGARGYSFIFASPKQHLVSIPQNTYPHLQVTTGAMTRPDNYRPNRIGMLGLQDHRIGGLVVEIRDKKTFHIRQVQADRDGSFYDLNYLYTPVSRLDAEAEAIYAGDFHAGWQDKSAVAALHEQIQLLKPKYLFTGDVFDGTSISHHHEKNIYKRLHHKPEHLKTLKMELENMVKEIEPFTKYPFMEFMAIRGNHEEALIKYLDSEDRGATFDIVNVKDPGAFLFYKRVAEQADPFQVWVEKEHPELQKVTWLNRKSSIRIAGIQCAVHGDIGTGGAKASPQSLAESLGDACTGHCHRPRIYHGIWTAGTLSVFNMPYTEAESASAWLHANISIYKSGMRQMLISVNGKWKL